MNLILFEETELDKPLLRSDQRAEHILKVLKFGVGDSFDVGEFNGPVGKATILRVSEAELELSFTWRDEVEKADPITLIVGLSRPQTMRKILNTAATMGVERMLFPVTERGEPSYAESKLWSTGEYMRHVREGVEQAFGTSMPEVAFGMSLGDAIQVAPTEATRLALDNYESNETLGTMLKSSSAHVALAIGSERGWTSTERTLLRDSGFGLAHLGKRVLRTETAVVSALAIAKDATGLWEQLPDT